MDRIPIAPPGPAEPSWNIVRLIPAMNGGEDCESLRDYRYYRRSFLNKPGYHATAFVYATVTRTRPEDEHACYATLDIADCSRTISLSISCDSEGEAANSLYKLDALIETLTEFREEFRKECELQRDRTNRNCQVKIHLT